MSTPIVSAPSLAWWLIRPADAMDVVAIIYFACFLTLAVFILTPMMTRRLRVAIRRPRAAGAGDDPHPKGLSLTMTAIRGVEEPCRVDSWP